MKKKDLLILISCVLGIFIINMLINGIYPFGSNDLAISDAATQYEPFLYDYITRLKNFNYYNYTFMNFLGNPSMFNFVYYLASPFNLIALLFNNYKLMYLSVIIIKLIIAAISAYHYFSKYDKKLGIIASICYVYSGWFLAYYFNIMWLDGFMMFPLLVIGVQNVLKNNPIIYILTLSYIYISNFYIGYMLSFFVLIYYLFKLITMKEKYYYKIKNFVSMIFYTCLIIGITFFHIYNVYNIILKNKLVTYSYDNPLILKDFITSLFSGNVNALFVNIKDYANICISVIALMGALSYFFNKNINKKEKRLNLCLLIIMLIILFSPKINYIIAGFTVPAGMPLRYTFIISFFLISLALKNHMKENISYPNYIILIVYTSLLLYSYFTKLINLNIFILNSIMIIIYLIYLIFNKKRFSKILISTAIIIECIIALNINLKGTNEITQSNFYNSSYSFSYFTSMTYKEPLNFVGGLGVLTDYKARVKDTNGIILEILENKIFGANETITKLTLTDDYLDNRNKYIYSLTDINNVIIKGNYTTKVNENIVTYKVKEDGMYHYLLSNNQYYIIWNNNIYLSTNDKKYLPKDYKKYSSTSSSFIGLIDLELKKDDEVIIYYSDDNYHDLYFENPKLCNEVINKIQKYNINYTEKKDNHLKGTITLDDNMIIYTTIPYDNAWKIKLDDKDVTPINLEGGFLGIKASKGNHTLELTYNDVTIWPFTISVLSIGIFIIIIKKYYKH